MVEAVVLEAAEVGVMVEVVVGEEDRVDIYIDLEDVMGVGIVSLVIGVHGELGRVGLLIGHYHAIVRGVAL